MDFIKPVGAFAARLSSALHNSYHLTIDSANPINDLSILSLTGSESLNQPWHYKITFTSSIHAI